MRVEKKQQKDCERTIPVCFGRRREMVPYTNPYQEG